MNIVNKFVLFISKATKRINKIFGQQYLYIIFNAVMLKLGIYRVLVDILLKIGAMPTVTAIMSDNTKILVDLRSNTEFRTFFSGEYDAELVEILVQLLNPDDYFLDIGSNVGFYSVSMGEKIRSKKGNGKVISFEPFAGNFNRLIDNIDLNNLEDYCVGHKIGLSNESLDALIVLREDFINGSGTGNASIEISENIDSKFEKAPIKLERLDDFWNKHYCDASRISLIKMDIEGHEDLCLAGGSKIIEKHRPTVLMEVNKPYYAARGVKLDEIFWPLIPEGYSIFLMINKKWKKIDTFDDCATIDNVFLVPNEKIAVDNYKVFTEVI